MTTSGTNDELAVGFLTVEHAPGKGFVGGLLVLNNRGRPLEFRCTAPVQPSRAQEVLYGPTLRPYVCGELIADALFRSTKLKPQIVFTNALENMSARNGLTIPLVYVRQPSEVEVDQGGSQEPSGTSERRWRLDQARSIEQQTVNGPKWLEFQLAQRHVAVNPEFSEDRETSIALWERASGWIDLAEPFERVGEAVAESLSH